MIFIILSIYCDCQNSTLCNTVEIEDEDEGSIFYANSTSLAVQVSSVYKTLVFFFVTTTFLHVCAHDDLVLFIFRLTT